MNLGHITQIESKIYGFTDTASSLEMSETTDPDPPAAGSGRIYMRDEGGKTQLVVQFGSGDPIEIAIEV